MSQSVLIVSINIKMDKPIVHFDVREKSRGKPTSPTMWLFVGFIDDKPVVIGLSKNINRSSSVYFRL